MAATLEGAFKIVDQASADLIKMRKEAEATDKAFESLGKRMDNIGGRKRAQDLDRNARAIRSVGLEAEGASRRMDRYERSTRNADRSTGGFGNRLNLAAKGLKSFGAELFKIARPAGMLVGMGTALGVAAQGVSSLAGGVVSLAPSIADLSGLLAPATTGVIGLGTAFLTTHLALQSLQKAMKGGPGSLGAMREIGTEGRKTIVQLRMMRGVIRELKQASSQGMFAGMLSGLKDLRRAAPSLEPILRRFSSTTGGLIATAGRRLTTPGALRDLQNIGGQGAGIEKNAGLGALNLADSLRDLLVVARPFTKWLSDTVLGWTRMLATFTRTGRESGRLQTFFHRAQTATQGLFHAARDLWLILRNLGRAARPAGEDLYRSMQKTLDAWVQITSTPEKRRQLIQDFDHMAVGLKAMARLAGALGLSLFNIGASGKLAQTANTLTGIVRPLEHILSGLANTFGPPMARTLVDFGTLIQNLGSGTGPLVTALRLVDSVLRGLNAIISATGGGGGAASTVLGGLLAGRLLQKTGLIGVGKGGVSRGALLGGRASTALAAGEGGIGAAALARMGAGAGGARALGMGSKLRMGLGAAGKIVPALALLQGGLAFAGGASQADGGSTLTRINAGSRDFLNAATFGGLKGIGHAFGWSTAVTPGEFAAERVAKDQHSLSSGMAAADRHTRGLERVNREMTVLRNHLTNFEADSTTASKTYVAQLNAEIASRKQLISQMNAEARQRGAARAGNLTAFMNRVFQAALPRLGRAGAISAAMTAGLGRFGSIRGRGQEAMTARDDAAARLLKATYGRPGLSQFYPQVVAAVLASEHRAGFHPQVRAGKLLTGRDAELGAISSALQVESAAKGQRGAGLTATQLDAIGSLIARGFTRRAARSLVLSLDNRSANLLRQTRLQQQGRSTSSRPEIQGGFSTGGRLAGSGGHDTVAVGGGFAAPGELWVNRHTEGRANQMLAPHGVTLEGLTDSETRRHSDSFSTGGRARYAMGGPAGGNAGGPMGRFGLKPGISAIGNTVLGRFPGLSVTSTTTGNHAANSYHFRRMAIDLGGTPAVMNTAAPWIASNLGASLLEGIHNRGLSVKNGGNVASSFWGATTWAGHRDHIHLAAGAGGSGAATGAQGGRNRGGGGGGGNRPALDYSASIAGLGGGDPINLGLGGLDYSPGVSTSTPGTGGGAGTTTAGGAPAGSAQRIAHAMLAQYGWGAGQWGPLQSLWKGESGWRWNADNPNSDAYGIPQALPGSKMASAGADWRTNPATQIKWGMGYIKGRYGTPASAYSSWLGRDPHWYSQGGRSPSWGGWHATGLDRTFSSPTLIGVGDKGAERVTVTPKGKGGRGGMTFAPQLNLTVHGGDPRDVHAAVTRALEEFATHLEHHPLDGEGDVSA